MELFLKEFPKSDFNTLFCREIRAEHSKTMLRIGKDGQKRREGLEKRIQSFIHTNGGRFEV